MQARATQGKPLYDAAMNFNARADAEIVKAWAEATETGWGKNILASSTLRSYRKRIDPEIAATAKAATVVLNVLLLGFVGWLTARLDSETRADEALWLVLLFATPPANALAILRSLPGRKTDDSAIT